MTLQSMPPSKLKVAILGATGTVGQRFVTLLADHPVFEIHALCASPRSAGKKYSTAVQWKLSTDLPLSVAAIPVDVCTAGAGSRLSECNVAFSGLDSDVASEIELMVARAGIPVFSNAKNFRMHAAVPLIVPTANGDHMSSMIRHQVALSVKALMRQELASLDLGLGLDRPNGYIVTNSNCSTTGLVVVLRALMTAFGPVDQVAVTSLQAVSGAGYPGLPVLDVFDNVVPYISGEEDKLETEPLKILGSVDTSTGTVTMLHPLTVSASCNRVPVLDGHTLNVSIRFLVRDNVPSPDAVSKVLHEYRPEPWDLLSKCPSCPSHAIHVSALPDRPQPRLDRDRGKGMTVTVGRIRKCPLLDIKLVVLSHNTILGAAGSSLLNAELAYIQGLLKAHS